VVERSIFKSKLREGSFLAAEGGIGTRGGGGGLVFCPVNKEKEKGHRGDNVGSRARKKQGVEDNALTLSKTTRVGPGRKKRRGGPCKGEKIRAGRLESLVWWGGKGGRQKKLGKKAGNQRG